MTSTSAHSAIKDYKNIIQPLLLVNQSRIMFAINMMCILKRNTDYFGYCVSDDGQLKNWEALPGDKQNQKTYALCVGYDNSFMYYGPNHSGSKQIYHDCSNYTISLEATVILSFDFVNDKVKLYCNDKNNLVKTMPLDGHKVITPLFSLSDGDESVELLRCKFYG